MRIGGLRAKGYFLDDMREVFRRYVPRAEFESLRAELMELPTEICEVSGARCESGPAGESVMGPSRGEL